MRVAVISIFGLLAAACGEDGVTVSTNEDNFCDEVAEVACHNLYQCCTEGEIEDYLEVDDPRTELQCRDDAKRICERRYTGVSDSIKNGRISFDGAKLDACLTAYLAPSGQCSQVTMETPWLEACKENPFVGQVAIGGTCFLSIDCAGSPDDTYCGTDQKCKAKPTGGFPCSTTGSNSCAKGFYCGPNNTCAPRAALGAPCTQVNQCADKLFCDTTATMPVCAEPKPGGEACTTDLGCKSSECVPGMCAGSSFETCFKDSDCDKRCGGNGITCTDPSQCGLGTCTNVGGSCSSPASCPSGSTCVFPTDCLPVDCVGDAVCTMEYVSVDYCIAITNNSTLF
jgi:hypothetical protein